MQVAISLVISINIYILIYQKTKGLIRHGNCACLVPQNCFEYDVGTYLSTPEVINN